MNNLLYLSAGSNKWGTGHLRRSLELINVFRTKGLHVSTAAIVPEKSELQQLASITGAYDKCIQSLDELEPFDAAGIVVDVHTDLQPGMLPWLQRQGRSVLALDWYCDTGGIDIETANLRGGAEELKYAIIRREFHDAFIKAGNARQKNYDAVVIIGGGDNRGHSDRIYRFFSTDKHFANRKVAFIPGQMAEGEITRIAGSSTGRISVLKNPDNIAGIMANASVGITNGGTTLMEFTMLGVPAVLFPQSEQEDNFIRTFLDKGSAVMGSYEADEFARQVTKIWDYEILRKTMSKKARELIDGLGAERITDLMLNTFFKGEYSKNEG